ncbi:hypothetical protein HDU83_008990 [Entophlyctis luteolus]|nr:hypothetical protein HDU83_008990 [Entophlyctis luteolus]KAJ3377898.1 hypothetical protein HDU84_008109 [Entophlyctis sp. JEL0112]
MKEASLSDDGSTPPPAAPPAAPALATSLVPAVAAASASASASPPPLLPKRKGRRPIEEAAATKRQNQKRAAARAFRERREAHLRDLETRAAELRAADAAESAKLRDRLTLLLSENAALKNNLAFSVATASTATSGGEDALPEINYSTRNTQVGWPEPPGGVAASWLPQFDDTVFVGGSRASGMRGTTVSNRDLSTDNLFMPQMRTASNESLLSSSLFP